ncbi:MAG: porin family protein [Bacteroidia bacterium]|nr:porin family protein [Bacteroidia bacterium]
MKRLVVILLFLTAFHFAQAQRDKEFQIRAGFGFALYSTRSEWGSGNLTQKDNGGAVTLHLPVDLRYELTRRLNMGLDLKIGSYLYDPDGADGKSNQYVVIGLAAEYNFINRDDFRWYGGAGYNFSNLELEESSELPGDDSNEEWTYRGGGFRFNTGVLLYIISDFGLNFNLGLDTHQYKLKKYKQDGNSIDLNSFEATLNTIGMDGTIGLVYRFGRD